MYCDQIISEKWATFKLLSHQAKLLSQQVKLLGHQVNYPATK